MKKSRHRVYVGAWPKKRADGRLDRRPRKLRRIRNVRASGNARSTIQRQFRRGDDLRSQVWRSAKEKPNFGVGGKSQLGLSACATVKFPGSYPLAIGTSAIPLGKTT